MSITKNFVAVDWRTGTDRIYFFFPEKNRAVAGAECNTVIELTQEHHIA